MTLFSFVIPRPYRAAIAPQASMGKVCLVAIALCLIAAVTPDLAMAKPTSDSQTQPAPLAFASNDALLHRYAGVLLADARSTHGTRLAQKTQGSQSTERIALENQLATIDQKLDWAFTAMRARNKRGGGTVLITFGSIALAGGVFVGTYVTIVASFGGFGAFLLSLLSGLALIGGAIAMIAVGARMLRLSSRNNRFLREKIRELRRQRRHLIYDLVDLKKRSTVGTLTLPQATRYAISMNW